MSSSVVQTVSFVTDGKANSKLNKITRDLPKLNKDELRVKILYASINGMDSLFLNAGNLFELPLPLGLGFDYSGIIEESTSDKFAKGDHVQGLSLSGTFSTQIVTPASKAMICKYKNGDFKSDAEAAAAGVCFLSAWEPLCIRENIQARKGQTIFIPGGSGGVGHYAVQLAKHYGLKVISSSSKAEGLKYLHSLDLEKVFDYSKENPVTAVLEATQHEGVDIVFDCTYKEVSMVQSAQVVKHGGKWVRLGAFDEKSNKAEEMVKSRGATAKFGDVGRYWLNPQFKDQVDTMALALEEGKRLHSEGSLRGFISKTVEFDVDKVEETIRHFDQFAGKAVVKIGA